MGEIFAICISEKDLQAEYIEDFYNSIMKWETTN